LVGGRCISLNGIYENILCLDVKSLYPAAMLHPCHICIRNVLDVHFEVGIWSRG
jgi:hypothetical protein